MSEGDSIYRVAASLRAALLGKALLSFETTRFFGVEPRVGSVIERVDSAGKHLEIGFDDGTVLHTQMRMHGSWKLYRIGETWSRPPQQARVVVTVDGFEAACFSAPIIETYRSHDYYWHPGLGRLGPELADQPVNIDDCVYRIDRFCEDERTVAETLLDQRIACGVGNVFKSEILWACCVHPDTCIGALYDDQRAYLMKTAATFVQAHHQADDPGTIVGPDGPSVYGRYRKPCRRCGESIDVSHYGENARVTYWCPGCQLYIPLPPKAEAPVLAPRRARPAWFPRPRLTAATPPAQLEPHPSFPAPIVAAPAVTEPVVPAAAGMAPVDTVRAAKIVVDFDTEVSVPRRPVDPILARAARR